MNRTRAALTVVTLAVAVALLALSFDPRWTAHLGWDVRRYGRYAGAFLATGSWAAVPGAEYQPGALWLFVAPQLLVSLGVPYELGMRLLLGALVALHVPLLLWLGGSRAAWSGVLLFLAAGPIALLRFEPFVSLLVLGALAAFRSSWLAASGAALGLASIAKLYPLLLIPVFATPLWTRSGARGLGRFSLGLLAGVAVPLAAYLATGGSLSALVDGLDYHAGKAVAVQSLLGTLVILVAVAHGTAVTPVHAHAMHGLAVAPGLRTAVNLLVLAAVVAIWAASWRGRRAPDTDSRLPIRLAAVTLAIGVLSTAYQPQYLLWPLALVALLPSAAGPRTGALAVGLLALALAALQVAFPLRYTDLLALVYERRLEPLPHAASALSIAAATATVTLAFREALRGSSQGR
jgi:hypothetical protein